MLVGLRNKFSELDKANSKFIEPGDLIKRRLHLFLYLPSKSADPADAIKRPHSFKFKYTPSDKYFTNEIILFHRFSN
jgi:hypothetical protein